MISIDARKKLDAEHTNIQTLLAVSLSFLFEMALFQATCTVRKWFLQLPNSQGMCEACEEESVKSHIGEQLFHRYMEGLSDPSVFVNSQLCKTHEKEQPVDCERHFGTKCTIVQEFECLQNFRIV